ncbi:GPALPP motifs-containing protein 1-like isoform X2 [Macrobrachium nipponense]
MNSQQKNEDKEDNRARNDSKSYGPSIPPQIKKNSNANEDSEDSEDDAYEPSLPPGFKSRRGHEEDKDEDSSDSVDSDSFGPSLPPRMKNPNVSDSDHSNSDKYGSGTVKRKNSESDIVPKKHMRTTEEEEDEDSVDEEDLYGPALPPHLIKNKSQRSVPKGERILGPVLPAGIVPPESSTFEAPEEEEDSEEDEGPLVGPMPSDVALNEKEYRAQQFELRAQRMKDKLEGKHDNSKPQKRESWMLELPEDKPNFCGLAPRQFLKKAPQEKGDRSVWTDTPDDKRRKAEAEMESEEEPSMNPVSSATRERDEDLTARVDQYNKEKRAKPLIDLHQKKMKKQEKESGPKERRPFSREEDLNVNKFDEAQKNNILKKARQLNDRFSAGDRKFL